MKTNQAEFSKMRESLLTTSKGMFAVFCNGTYRGIFPSQREASGYVTRFTTKNDIFSVYEVV
jgi:hypothetical protein